MSRFNNKISCNICPVKGNRKSIATIISDDGDVETSYALAKLSAQYNAKITIAPTIENVLKNVEHWLFLEKIFEIDIVNHSWNHLYLNTPGMSLNEIRHQIIDLANFLGKYFKSPNFSFIPPGNQMTETSYGVLSEGNFIAARGWRRDLNSLKPVNGIEPGQWYNLKCRGIGDEDFDAENNIASMSENPAWLIEMWHNVCLDAKTGYQPIEMESAEKNIHILVNNAEIWLATFNEAISYLFQRDNVVPHVFFHEGILHLKLNAKNPYLPWEKFKTPLTVAIGGLPFDELEIIEGIDNVSVSNDGDLLIDIYPERHGQLKIRYNGDKPCR